MSLLLPLLTLGGALALPAPGVRAPHAADPTARVRQPPVRALQAPELRPPELRIVELHGTPYERGLQHGTALREEIRALIEATEQDFQNGHGLEVAEYQRRFLAGTRFQESIRRWCPDLLDEIRGIAAGAQLDFDRVYAFQLIDEHWSQGQELSRVPVPEPAAPSAAQQGRDPGRHHCTSFAVAATAEHPAVVGQNLDIPPFFHPYPVLLRIRDQARQSRSLVVTVPGLIGANGVSDVGLAVCVNTLLHLQPSLDGLPVAFVVRRVLQCASFEEAEAFLREVRHASGQNYVIGGSRRVLSLECAADVQQASWPAAHRRFTFHTNHPLANTALRPGLRPEGAAPWSPGSERCDRLAVLQEIFAAADARPGMTEVMEALRNRDGPGVTIDNAHTFCCTVFEMQDPPVLHLCVGRPADGHFAPHRFD